MSVLKDVRELRGKTGAAAVVGLGAAAVWIALLAIVGAIAVSGDRSNASKVTSGRAVSPHSATRRPPFRITPAGPTDSPDGPGNTASGSS